MLNRFCPLCQVLSIALSNLPKESFGTTLIISQSYDWRLCHWLQYKENRRGTSNIPFANLTFWNYLTFESLMAIFAPFQPCILSFMEWKGQVLQRERRKIQHIFTIKCPLFRKWSCRNDLKNVPFPSITFFSLASR